MYHLLLFFFQVRPANWPTITGVTLCLKKFRRPRYGSITIQQTGHYNCFCSLRMHGIHLILKWAVLDVDMISTVKPTRCTKFSNLFYFGIKLYIFQTVFPSIIRSSRPYIQQRVCVKQILLPACQQERDGTATRFGRSFHPSSGGQDFTYSNRYMSNRFCYLLASGNEMELLFHLVPARKQVAESV